MAAVQVVRFGGDKEGEPVVEPLATSLEAKVKLGTSIIDEKSLDGLEKTVKIPYTPDIFLGAMVRVTEDILGKVLVGKVSSFEHQIAEVERYTSITVRGVIQ
ncbi:hypothetical protein [Vibrio phage vB_VpS_PG28]|nr:hypothetical protein [Vibrio phage vB_VpS_PG28]